MFLQIKRLIILIFDNNPEINGITLPDIADGEVLILNSGDVLSVVRIGDLDFNGYLADEYFANCGGGGSSSSTSSATISSLSKLSYLDSSLTTLSSLFVFGCIDPTAFNYDPTANYSDGSCRYTPLIEILIREELFFTLILEMEEG